MSDQVILVAFHVDADSEAEGIDYLRRSVLPSGEDFPSRLDGWWIAEDGRNDFSDNDSAVFVPMGRQAEAYRILREAFTDDSDYQSWTEHEFGSLA